MSIFPDFKNKEELILVFDIGSSAIGASLFIAQKSGIPKIIFSARDVIPLEEDFNVSNFLNLVLKTLDGVVEKVFKAGLGVPTQFFCVLSSTWSISQTRTITLKKNVPFVFNTKLADSLIDKEVKLFEEENLKKYSEIENSVRTIELKNVKTILNGYETPNPLEQKAKDLEMVLFVSISSEAVLKEIENTIAKHYHFDKIIFSSFMMASFTVLRDLFPKQENFLLVDIGGEVTEVSMIKKSMIRESLSFPLGFNFLKRGIAKQTNTSLEETNSLISMFNDGHIEEKLLKKISPVMTELRSSWLTKFQESLANLSNDISIPSAIYITTDKKIATFFSDTIKSEQFSQYTLTESKFEVNILNTEILHDIAKFEVETIRDPSLIVDSIYINRFLVN